MIKYFAIGLMLSGCGVEEETIKRLNKNLDDTGNRYIKIRCMKGVEYYSGSYVLAVAYNVDGSLRLCDG